MAERCVSILENTFPFSVNGLEGPYNYNHEPQRQGFGLMKEQEKFSWGFKVTRNPPLSVANGEKQKELVPLLSAAQVLHALLQLPLI